MTAAKQITVRNPSPVLVRRLKTLAASRGDSLNTTILKLLEQAVGIDERRERLLRYATWTEQDLAEFQGELRAQRQIDEKLWK
jgi:hypothetical protein